MQQLQIPALAEGEKYVGAIGDKLGNVHHIILLVGDNDGASHQAQLDWAHSIGGDLPTRAEQALMWQECRGEFRKEAYWSNETDEDDEDYAWCQNFHDGLQGNDRKYDELRARAVRRLPI